MLYAFEKRSAWFILGFSIACTLGSAYGFLQGAGSLASTLRSEIETGGEGVGLAVRRGLVELAGKEAVLDAVPAHFEGDSAGQAKANTVLSWLSGLRAG